jgi:hypothetical protein
MKLTLVDAGVKSEKQEPQIYGLFRREVSGAWIRVGSESWSEKTVRRYFPTWRFRTAGIMYQMQIIRP